MMRIALRSSLVGISVLLALVVQGCDPQGVQSQNLNALHLMGAELAILEVHQEQERDQELLALQTTLRDTLQTVAGVRDVSVAIWIMPPDEHGARTTRFLATAELAPGDESSAAGIRSQFVTIARTVLPNTVDVAARAPGPLLQHVIVLNGILCP